MADDDNGFKPTFEVPEGIPPDEIEALVEHYRSIKDEVIRGIILDLIGSIAASAEAPARRQANGKN